MSKLKKKPAKAKAKPKAKAKAKAKPKAKAKAKKPTAAGFRFESVKHGYKVYKRGKLLGEIIPSREPTGRHCFYLGLDRRKTPRTYRGKLKSAEALEAIDKLISDAKSKKWKPEILVVNAWDYRPTASDQW